MADVFIEVEKKKGAIMGVRRTIGLLFGDPETSGPTPQEFAMQLATQTQTMSPELGLRVGAVIMSRRGDVLAVGTNQHPIESASPGYDAGAVDLRHLGVDIFERLVGSGLLSNVAEEKIGKDPEGFVADLLTGALKDSELRALTEYQRPVHAEMNALIAALRQRVSLKGATIYVSAYPCHNCAKHLIAVGLKVVYLSPYAKSKAGAMYGKDVEGFRPFTGVAPRRFQAFFLDAKQADRKDELGERVEWTAERKAEQPPKVTPQISMRAKQVREDVATPSK
jgi:deoxycytidylate deaminase